MAPTKKPTTINDYPEVATARANLDRILGDLAGAESDLRVLWEKQFEGPNVRAANSADAVAAILRGEDVVVTAEAPNLAESIGATRRRVELLKLAVTSAEQKHSHAVAVCSRDHCASIIGEWRAVARPVAETLIAFARALQAAEEFKANLQRSGIEIGSMSSADAITPFGDRATDSPLAFRLRDLVEAGAIEPKDIPWPAIREFAARALKQSA
jgi:hypothetical protein